MKSYRTFRILFSLSNKEVWLEMEKTPLKVWSTSWCGQSATDMLTQKYFLWMLGLVLLDRQPLFVTSTSDAMKIKRKNQILSLSPSFICLCMESRNPPFPAIPFTMVESIMYNAKHLFLRSISCLWYMSFNLSCKSILIWIFQPYQNF